MHDLLLNSIEELTVAIRDEWSEERSRDVAIFKQSVVKLFVTKT